MRRALLMLALAGCAGGPPVPLPRDEFLYPPPGGVVEHVQPHHLGAVGASWRPLSSGDPCHVFVPPPPLHDAVLVYEIAMCNGEQDIMGFQPASIGDFRFTRFWGDDPAADVQTLRKVRGQ